MTTLITGGTGFIGLALGERLASLGERVVLFDRKRLTPNVRPNIPIGCEVIEGDLLCDNDLRGAFSAACFDRVVHAAALTPDLESERREAEAIFKVNLGGTIRLLEQCSRQRNLKRVLVLSSVAVFGASKPAKSGAYEEEASCAAPTTLYGISKLAAEQAALRIADLHGIDMCIARLGPVFGPWEHASGARPNLSPHYQVLEAAFTGKSVVLPRKMLADWMYSRDAAAGLAALSLAPQISHTLYHVGSGCMTDVTHWCKALEPHAQAFRWRIAEDGEVANVIFGLPNDRPGLGIERLAKEMHFSSRYDIRRAAVDYVRWKAASLLRSGADLEGSLPNHATLLAKQILSSKEP